MLTGDLGLLQSTQEEAPADLYRATRLPLTLSALQPCLDALLGVGSGDPTQRAEDVLVELLALKDVFPFDIRAPIARVESRARSKR
jgi:hypothetical protein